MSLFVAGATFGGRTFGDAGILLFVAGATVGDVGASLAVAGVTCGEI